MDGVTLLQQARDHGLRVEVTGGELTVRGGRRCADLAREILARKEEVLAALGHEREHPTPDTTPQKPENPEVVSGSESTPRRRQEALRVWEEAVRDVARLWEEAAAVARARGESPPWLDETLDARLQSELADALRAGDVEEARRSAAAWKAAWEGAISPDTRRNLAKPEEKEGFVGSPLSRELRERLEARARSIDGVALFDLAEDEDLAAAERQVYREEILARADELIAESEGRKPRPNQTVWDMHSEARARPDWRDTEERSLTSWLRRHAPAVAAAWPEASVDAAWIDWRRKIGAEHVPTIDAALAAVAPDGGQRDAVPNGAPDGASAQPSLRGVAGIPQSMAQTTLPLFPEPIMKDRKGDGKP